VFATLPWQPRHTFTSTPPYPSWEHGLLATVDVDLRKGVMS
jgi:hypothetical protein